MTQKFINVSQEAGAAFFTSPLKGRFYMLNLLKFKEVADYVENPGLKPAQEISGEDAYTLYMEHTMPLLSQAGSEVIFQGKSAPFLIGPENEKWDLVLLVKHSSKENFLAFASDEKYLSGAGHRTAALEDSRLLPIYK